MITVKKKQPATVKQVMTVDNNGCADQSTFAIRLREIFFELARREEASHAYEVDALRDGFASAVQVAATPPR